jgi:hypothetical protein
VTHVSGIDGTMTVRWSNGEETDGWTADELIVIPKMKTMKPRNTQARRRVGTGPLAASSDSGGHITHSVYFDGEPARNAFGYRYGWLFPKAGGSLLFV